MYNTSITIQLKELNKNMKLWSDAESGLGLKTEAGKKRVSEIMTVVKKAVANIVFFSFCGS